VPAPSERYQTRPFLPIRRAYLHVYAAGRRKDLIHGLVEFDVTDARKKLGELEAAGHPLSFAAFVLYAVARAVDADRIVHAYRRRNRLVLFDDVDVNFQVESELDGQKVVKSVIIRAANRKTVEELSAEIRIAQRKEPTGERRYRSMRAFLFVPRPIRSLAWRVIMANPWWVKRLGGTVGMSSIGMFGPNGGWGIPIAPATLMITIGGIARKPRIIDGSLQERELLAVTISVDHAIVDGAPAARFAARLAELVESADSLADGQRSDPLSLTEAARTSR